MSESPAVLASGDAVISSSIDLNACPNRTLVDMNTAEARAVLQPMHDFGEACRLELEALG